MKLTASALCNSGEKFKGATCRVVENFMHATCYIGGAIGMCDGVFFSPLAQLLQV